VIRCAGRVAVTDVGIGQVKAEHLHQLILELRVGRFVPLSGFPVLSVFLREIEISDDDRLVPSADRSVPSADRVTSSGSNKTSAFSAGSFAAPHPFAVQLKSSSAASSPLPPTTVLYPGQNDLAHQDKPASPSPIMYPPLVASAPFPASFPSGATDSNSSPIPRHFVAQERPASWPGNSPQAAGSRAWQRATPRSARLDSGIQLDSESTGQTSCAPDQRESASVASTNVLPHTASSLLSDSAQEVEIDRCWAVVPAVEPELHGSSGHKDAAELVESLKLLDSTGGPGGYAGFRGVTDDVPKSQVLASDSNMLGLPVAHRAVSDIVEDELVSAVFAFWPFVANGRVSADPSTCTPCPLAMQWHSAFTTISPYRVCRAALHRLTMLSAQLGRVARPLACMVAPESALFFSHKVSLAPRSERVVFRRLTHTRSSAWTSGSQRCCRTRWSSRRRSCHKQRGMASGRGGCSWLNVHIQCQQQRCHQPHCQLIPP
jgi:hypothetical protein